MNIKLLIKQTKNPHFDYFDSKLFQIQEFDDNGKWVKHLKHDPELIAKINNTIFKI